MLSRNLKTWRALRLLHETNQITSPSREGRAKERSVHELQFVLLQGPQAAMLAYLPCWEPRGRSTLPRPHSPLLFSQVLSELKMYPRMKSVSDQRLELDPPGDELRVVPRRRQASSISLYPPTITHTNTQTCSSSPAFTNSFLFSSLLLDASSFVLYI